jgi:hypothetical protein
MQTAQSHYRSQSGGEKKKKKEKQEEQEGNETKKILNSINVRNEVE